MHGLSITCGVPVKPDSARSTQHAAPIRPATAADQPAIRALVLAARLNPTGLDWRRFLVAVDPEAGARIVGVAQVKPHRDGSRELASLAVVPGRQGAGIGAALVRALLARETGPLYLMCAGPLAGYYTRFGFRHVGPAALPPYFRRVHRAARIAGATVFRGLGDLAIMRREAGEPGGAAAHGARTTDAPRPDLRPYGIASHWLKPGPAARTLLVVLAHPDDESFGSGGTLARYGAEGVAVHYACATRGECGTVDPALLAAGESGAALRTGELLCAADALGLAGVHFLGHRDSGMPGTPDNRRPHALVQAPPARVTGQIVAIIRALRPQVVLTFPPYGGYGHPDHIRVHETALAAFHAAGNPAQYPEQVAAGLAPERPRSCTTGRSGRPYSDLPSSLSASPAETRAASAKTATSTSCAPSTA